MPLSISARERRRPPATDAASAYAATTNVASSVNDPSAGTLVPRRLRGRLCVVLRRAFCHHAVRLDEKAVLMQLPFQHDFRVVLERVGDDARVARVDDLAVVFDLELVVERVRPLPEIGDVAMELQFLALPD